MSKMGVPRFVSVPISSDLQLRLEKESRAFEYVEGVVHSIKSLSRKLLGER